MSERAPGDFPVVELPLLKAEAVSELLGVPVGTVRDFARTGRLPCILVGRRVLFNRPEVVAVVERAIRENRRI